MVAPPAPIWVRDGLVVDAGIMGHKWSPHCQMPTPILVNDTTLRLFFNSRDELNRSHIFWIDISAEPPWRISGMSDGPVLTPGAKGRFDASGVMPTALVDRGDELWMYYIGWTCRTDVPYHNAIGIARSLDKGVTFERMLPGPVMGTGPTEPFFCGTAEVAKIGEQWVMWYMSATEWRDVGGRPEPRYHLKRATSADGVSWTGRGEVAVDYLTDDEGGIARAAVLKNEDGYWMWFCHRGIADYRGEGAEAYRLGVAWSPDSLKWQRLPEQPVFSTGPAKGAFDEFMECYPAVFQARRGTYLFYNGSDFGQTGIGVARLANPS